ncbi:hypothetical protein AVEN_45761-1 [Araneus ventricosus]|uniref:Uncharacterized protein n=1 Tax=Araneus ventricosus TaxID=182803 RepID=A0A4Y2RSX5_ARAVE|nr:hypothetical protein AVEN_45761-1 [Araneus ventricosus]
MRVDSRLSATRPPAIDHVFPTHIPTGVGGDTSLPANQNSSVVDSFPLTNLSDFEEEKDIGTKTKLLQITPSVTKAHWPLSQDDLWPFLACKLVLSAPPMGRVLLSYPVDHRSPTPPGGEPNRWNKPSRYCVPPSETHCHVSLINAVNYLGNGKGAILFYANNRLQTMARPAVGQEDADVTGTLKRGAFFLFSFLQRVLLFLHHVRIRSLRISPYRSRM